MADGSRIEDPDWGQDEDGKYWVVTHGQKTYIPDDRIIPGTNRVGYAILWWPAHFDHPTCFLPGTRS